MIAFPRRWLVLVSLGLVMDEGDAYHVVRPVIDKAPPDTQVP